MEEKEDLNKCYVGLNININNNDSPEDILPNYKKEYNPPILTFHRGIDDPFEVVEADMGETSHRDIVPISFNDFQKLCDNFLEFRKEKGI